MAATLMMCLVCFLQLGGVMVFAAHGYSSHPLPQVEANYGDTSWCIAKPSTLKPQLENIINYCCVEIGLDCSIIQPGGACYLGYNKVSDASVVMNLYYNDKGKAPVNCNFSNSGITIYTDPSVGNCVYRAA